MRATKRVRNTNDTADVLDAKNIGATYIKIADANEDRTFFHVHNGVEPNKACWVRLSAAGAPTTKKGILLHETGKGKGHWEMPSDNIYTGEISARSDSSTCDIYVTEY